MRIERLAGIFAGCMALVAGAAFAGVCPGEGDCFVEGGNGTPGCDDQSCCLAVCAVDPFCCETSWDGICADEAADLCAPACPSDCLGDLNDDFMVNGADLGLLLGNWGGAGCGDLNVDGVVNGADLGLLLGAWGPCVAPPCPGDGDCCEPNDTPGCDNEQCCEIVCAQDAFCCDVSWDGICADAAADLCGPLCAPEGACCLPDGSCVFGSPEACANNGGVYQGDGVTCADADCPQPVGCGDADTGSCCESNGTPYCDDADCCEAVCAVDSFCCDVSWDSACASEAIDICEGCFQCGSEESGDCFENNGTPYCNDAECCEAVCAADPFCCDTSWDGICAGAALDICIDDPEGACCLPDGSCVFGTVQACANNGGVYQGDGVTCADANCPPPPPGCGDAGTGSCCEDNGTPYCDDADCCEAVCAQDSFCCNTSWDGLCAGAAIDICAGCFQCGSAESGDCFENNGTPYCNDAECCEAVCAQDTFCCDTSWDGLCADAALDICIDDPEGACCFSDGSCTFGTAAACANAGGIYQGDNVSCASAKCPQPPACGDAGSGSCCESNGTPFCDDAACCEAVCAADSFCCSTSWDQACANQAINICEGCFQCGSTGSGDCFQDGGNGTPFCDDADCCEAVCAQDDFCCNTSWDGLCADAAADICGSACPGDGGCYESNGSPGCNDAACCETVCAADPFCCDNTWDGICAGEAAELCGNCGAAGAGECFINNGTPGCDDFECCAAVCAADPFCCNNSWDGLCADEAADLCGNANCPGEGDCFQDGGNGTPGCNDGSCCELVCEADPFCCDTSWDGLCADQAIDICG